MDRRDLGDITGEEPNPRKKKKLRFSDANTHTIVQGGQEG
jgi:hypothetical protein